MMFLIPVYFLGVFPTLFSRSFFIDLSNQLTNIFSCENESGDLQFTNVFKSVKQWFSGGPQLLQALLLFSRGSQSRGERGGNSHPDEARVPGARVGRVPRLVAGRGREQRHSCSGYPAHGAVATSTSVRCCVSIMGPLTVLLIE